jgi:hypothetical protein
VDERKPEMSHGREANYKELLWRNFNRGAINKDPRVKNYFIAVIMQKKLHFVSPSSPFSRIAWLFKWTECRTWWLLVGRAIFCFIDRVSRAVTAISFKLFSVNTDTCANRITHGYLSHIKDAFKLYWKSDSKQTLTSYALLHNLALRSVRRLRLSILHIPPFKFN